MTIVLTGDSIIHYRALVLLNALRLECKGMNRRGISAYSLAKSEYNLKGNKLSVLSQLESILNTQTLH